MRLLHHFDNIRQLGLKELHSLYRDPALVLLIIWSFSFGVFSSAHRLPETPNRATVGVVDEDRSVISQRLIDALQLPYFLPPEYVTLTELDAGMDAGDYIFTVVIPAGFQADLLGGHQPQIQLNVDATQITQAFSGARHIQNIFLQESQLFLQSQQPTSSESIESVIRVLYNPNLVRSWLGGINEVINQITLLSIILSGAAVIREREHGTIEHLLVMPISPLEIMLAKIWSMGLVVLGASALSLLLVVNLWLGIPLQGSLSLFLGATVLHLFSTTSIGIFYGTLARSMPQLGLMIILTLMPLQILSGGMFPRESMPDFIQQIMLIAPTTHFVLIAQGIFFRDAGIEVIWPQLLCLGGIGCVFFSAALSRLRCSLQ